MPIIKNKNLMYQVIENMASMIRVMDSDNNIIYMNKKMRDEFGDKVGMKCHSMMDHSGKCDECISEHSILTGQAYAKELEFDEKVYRIISSPANSAEQGSYAIEIFHDITDQKNIEEESRIHYEKLKGDIEFAKHIQRKTLPDDKVYWNAVKTYSSYLPSEDLSGDLFDIVKVDENNCLFYIADVSGHGVRSSLMTIFLRQVIRGMKEKAANHAAVLDELIKGYHDLDLDKEQFTSLIYGIYNKKTRGLSIINAGHNCLPIILENGRGVSTKITELEIKGMPICSLLSTPNHEIKTLQMEKGDKILLYTDGITEAFNRKENREFGTIGLMDVIRKVGVSDCKELANSIIEEAKKFAGGSPMDDMAVLIIELL